MVELSNFILNSNFTSEKMLPAEYTISGSITGGLKEHKTLLGSFNVTVPNGNYIINAIHSNSNNTNKYTGINATYIETVSYIVFGEVLQTSSTNIRLNVYIIVSGGGSATIPSFTVSSKVKLSYLPLDW